MLHHIALDPVQYMSLSIFCAWAIEGLLNFLFFVALKMFCLYAISPNTHSAYHWHKFFRQVVLCFPLSFNIFLLSDFWEVIGPINETFGLWARKKSIPFYAFSTKAINRNLFLWRKLIGILKLTSDGDYLPPLLLSTLLFISIPVFIQSPRLSNV